MAQLRERYHFIHNVFANFFKDTLDFFSSCLYDRFEYRVVGTYDKAVEYINKQCEYGRETDKPMLPALVLNPSGEFAPADANSGGRQYWRYPNLAPTMIKRLFKAIYKDENLIVNAGFLRIKGEIELIMLLNSFYEYCDLRLLFINMFGGMDRIIYPLYFTSFIILPESFVKYEYRNPYTGKHYNIDWAGASASDLLVKTTATNELVLPLRVKPQYALTSLADGSNRYGGTDNIAEWKLTASINYEIEIPNYLIIESDYLAEEADVEIQYGSAYSVSNDYAPPDSKILYNFAWDWGLNEQTNTPDKLDPLVASDATCEISFVGDYRYYTRYFHVVTAAEAALCDSTSNLEISLPEQIIDPKILLVNSRDGQLVYGDHYYIADNGWTLVIRTGDTHTQRWEECPPLVETEHWVCLKEGWILELYVYKRL
jgi:hypothetical protein